MTDSAFDKRQSNISWIIEIPGFYLFLFLLLCTGWPHSSCVIVDFFCLVPSSSFFFPHYEHSTLFSAVAGVYLHTCGCLWLFVRSLRILDSAWCHLKGSFLDISNIPVSILRLHLNHSGFGIVVLLYCAFIQYYLTYVGKKFSFQTEH